MSRLRLAVRQGGYLHQHWRRLSTYGVIMAIAAMVTVQLAFPWNNLPLYTTIDGISVGGMAKRQAVTLLNKKYQQLNIGLYFSDNTATYRQPHPSDLGFTVNSRPEVDSASYSLWLRLVPTSLWWAHHVISPTSPDYVRNIAKTEAYIHKELGQSCDVKPQNASVAFQNNKLQAIPSSNGGTCDLSNVQKLLTSATPTLIKPNLRIPMNVKIAGVHDNTAINFIKQLTQKTQNVTIDAGGSPVAIPQNTLLSWLDFTAPDSGIVATVNTGRAGSFFTQQLAPKVAIAAGTTQVSTLDFNETGRVDGVSGQILDAQATADALSQWLAGNDGALEVQVQAVAPAVVYSRTYSNTNTGLSALLTQFAASNPGTFGISYAELTGANLHAGYNDTKIFETASIYKLFVTYATLKRIESGQWNWTDQIQGGRDLAKCFDDMIVLSDNACAEALLGMIGYSELTTEIKAAGFTHSSFMNSYIETTPADLALYLGMLQSGQLLSPSSTSTLISAMKRNVYRQGIPSGTNGVVADKVGFLNPGYIQGVPGTVNLLHDASIVYDPSGTYVLVVMTGNSSWATIAALTHQIEIWRASN